MSRNLLALFGTVRRALTVPLEGKAKPEDIVRVYRDKIDAYVPHYWPEEAKTVEEWMIRLFRSFGFHATWQDDEKRFEVRLTRNAADEATITWPGRDNMAAAAKHGKGWSHEAEKG